MIAQDFQLYGKAAKGSVTNGVPLCSAAVPAAGVGASATPAGKMLAR
jgi:hypothetical protein